MNHKHSYIQSINSNESPVPNCMSCHKQTELYKICRLLVDLAKLNQGVFFLNKYLANKENNVSNFDICWKGKADL